MVCLHIWELVPSFMCVLFELVINLVLCTRPNNFPGVLTHEAETSIRELSEFFGNCFVLGGEVESLA